MTKTEKTSEVSSLTLPVKNPGAPKGLTKVKSPLADKITRGGVVDTHLSIKRVKLSDKGCVAISAGTDKFVYPEVVISNNDGKSLTNSIKFGLEQLIKLGTRQASRVEFSCRTVDNDLLVVTIGSKLGNSRVIELTTQLVAKNANKSFKHKLTLELNDESIRRHLSQINEFYSQGRTVTIKA